MKNYQEREFSRTSMRSLILIHKSIKCTSFRQGLPESRLHGWFRLTIHGTGYPLPGGYDELPEHLCITMRCARRVAYTTAWMQEVEQRREQLPGKVRHE